MPIRLKYDPPSIKRRMIHSIAVETMIGFLQFIQVCGRKAKCCSRGRSSRREEEGVVVAVVRVEEEEEDIVKER